jgi:hypothetical protein
MGAMGAAASVSSVVIEAKERMRCEIMILVWTG